MGKILCLLRCFNLLLLLECLWRLLLQFKWRIRFKVPYMSGLLWRGRRRSHISHVFSVTLLEVQHLRLLAAEVLLQNFMKCGAKLFDPKSIDDWIYSRVAMGEQDGDVEQNLRSSVFAEECDAVDYMKRQPANGKQDKHQNQRFGKIQLFVVVLVGV